mgnify:CR=1 FL=1
MLSNPRAPTNQLYIMKNRVFLPIIGLIIAAFVGWALMAYLLMDRPVNWLLAVAFALIFGLAYGGLSIMRLRKQGDMNEYR